MPSLDEMIKTPLQGILGVVGLLAGGVIGGGLASGTDGFIIRAILIGGFMIGGVFLGTYISWVIAQKNKN